MNYHSKTAKLLLSTLLILTSCSPKNPSSVLKIFSSDYFSMRQQTPTIYMGLIQLHSPGLLAVTKKNDNGKLYYEAEARQAVLDEQQNAIEQLQALSPEIKILASYKMVLNAIAFSAPSDLADKISKIEGVEKVLESSNFERPQTFEIETPNAHKPLAGDDIDVHNTVTFIGADKLHSLGIKGQGLKIGIIDTGIDYTHAMFGGPGKKEAYESIDPKTSNSLFPNQVVVGGVDFVGSDFAPSSEDPQKKIPVRDNNPIDESGHGTHVAGTIAGMGDNKNTYSGVAPEAKLYALKVFGKQGGTSDIVVIQALEYAADPTESMNPNLHLNVVNLSLGGGYGKPKVLYSEAIKNLTRAGTVVVASAGNSGDNPYIVGAPSTSDEAISVAASIDDLAQNIAFTAGELSINGNSKLVEIVEGKLTSPSEESHVSAPVIYIGNSVDPIAEDIKTATKGKIALIDRGGNSFVDKLSLAQELGAVGVIVVNNQEGEPIQMGGDKKFSFPAIMITKNLGINLKEILKNNQTIEFNFSPGKTIKRDDLVDTITNFSSRGPRSIDSLIKPEIAAPGANVISAKMGGGDEAVQLSGTSMSGPHIAGVMTLLKQAFPALSVAELKAKALNTSKILMKDGVHVPVSMQGAGRVQVEKALSVQLLAMPATLSLGEVSVSSNKTVAKSIKISNLSDQDLVLTTRSIHSKNVSVSLPATFKVKAKASATITASFTLLRAKDDLNNIEADGFILMTSGDGKQQINLPFLAVLNKVTNIEASDFTTMTNSPDDKFGSEVRLTLTNKGQNDGDALLFNLLGVDERKTITPPLNLSKNTSCDLESAGLRIIEKEVEGELKKVLQVGVKLYDSLTQWQPCDISLQIDTDRDEVADLELVGIKGKYIAGIGGEQFVSALLDAKMAKDIRKDYELNPEKVKEDYAPALLGLSSMKFYDHASVAVVEVELSKIGKDKKGNVGIKLAVSNLENDGDDFLASHAEKWQSVNLSENAFAFYDMPEVVTVGANDLQRVSMKRGAGSSRLLVLYPHNAPAVNDILRDLQSQILSEKLLK